MFLRDLFPKKEARFRKPKSIRKASEGIRVGITAKAGGVSDLGGCSLADLEKLKKKATPGAIKENAGPRRRTDLAQVQGKGVRDDRKRKKKLLGKRSSSRPAKIGGEILNLILGASKGKRRFDLGRIDWGKSSRTRKKKALCPESRRPEKVSWGRNSGDHSTFL